VYASHFKTGAPGREWLFAKSTKEIVPFNNDYARVKEELAAGNPVVIGFTWDRVANPLNPALPPYYMYDYGDSAGALGGHAVCLVGYDDNYAGVGAFKCINSFGTTHGQGGFNWISYSLMEDGVQEAWVLTDQEAAPPQIAAAEYFIESFTHDLRIGDPGPGAGIGIPAPVDGSYDQRIESVTLTVSSASLLPGLYSLGLRFMSLEGVWGVPHRFDFRVDGQGTLQNAEAFVDNDPGPGNGVPLAAGDGGVDGSVEGLTGVMATNSLTQDLHNAFVRVQDDFGRWSHPRFAKFEVGPPKIKAAEWAPHPMDNLNPGNPMLPIDGTFDSGEETVLAANVNASWPEGQPRLVHVRVQGALGRWSQSATEELQILPTPTISSTPTITPTPTVTTTSTATPTGTPTVPTSTPTPTRSYTATPSLTATLVGPTSTPTPTVTPGSATPTPTNTLGGPTPTATFDIGDLNKDGKVDAKDLYLFLDRWHPE
jgi:hypothetical protein